MNEQLDRIEQKIDALAAAVDMLLSALAEDEEEPGQTLEGEASGRERDQNQGL